MIVPPLAMPIYDLFLRFDPYGQLSLTNERIWLSNWIIAIFLCTVVAVVELFISHSGLDSLGVYILAFLIAGFLIGWFPSRKSYSK
jgi:hypothetical protein